MTDRHLPTALLLLRFSLVVFFAIWIADKFARPEHTAAVWAGFYGFEGMPELGSYLIGGVQAVLLLLFGLGVARTLTYGALLAMHGITTLASFPVYLAPWESANILFFAAWPTLGALGALFLLRDADTLLTVGRRAG